MPFIRTRTFFSAIFFLIFSLAATSVQAVILGGGDGTGNTVAPSDDPGWANVGQLGAGSAVYLQDNWVITCRHVGAGTVNFGGTNYSYEAGSVHNLHEPGNSNLVDLTLFRLTSTPSGVTNLTVSSSAPSLTSNVTAVGYGRNRATSNTTWYVDTTPGTWVWNTSPFGGWDTNFYGYTWASGQTKRWGTNNVDSRGSTLNAGFGTTYYLGMSFSQSGGADEMMYANGDSGGGLFYKNGSNWELSGLGMTIGTYNNQPGSTAVFGDLSAAVDLSRYRDQIVAIVPEPASLTFLGLGGLMLLRRQRGRK